MRSLALAAFLLASAATGGACASSSARPTAVVTSGPTAVSTPTQTAYEAETQGPTMAATPTLVKSAPPPEPTPSPTAPPTPVPPPNLVATALATTPARPVCQVDFQVDVLVRNTGRGPMPGDALLAVAGTRTTDGWIGIKYIMTIPALTAGGSIHMLNTIQVARAGTYDVTVYVDSSSWLAESREDDNKMTATITASYGSCPKA